MARSQTIVGTTPERGPIADKIGPPEQESLIY